jgi:dolichol kinase
VIRYAGELTRKSIHVASLAIPVALYWLPENVSRPILLALTLVTLAVDVVRLHVPQVRTLFYFLFGRIIRDHERFNLLGSTYLLMAALLCMYAFPKPVAVVAIAFVVVGDAVAALVGRRWGRVRILDKSLEGSLACFAACVLIGRIYPGDAITWPMTLVGALVATLFELLPIPLDDNLRMSLSAGFAMTLLG